MTATDVYAILEDVYGKSPWNLKQIEADMAKTDTAYLFLGEGKPHAFLAAQFLGEEAEITQLAVKKSQQGKGYGKELLHRFLDHTGSVFLEVRASNQVAISLYESVGFVSVGLRKNYYHDPIEDACVMRRERDVR